MKLIYPEIGRGFDLTPDYFYGLVIENPGLFYRFATDIYNQSIGLDGDAVLSQNNTPISIAKHLDFTSSFIPFELNRKTILTKITTELEKIGKEPLFREQGAKIVAEWEKYLYALSDASSGNISLDFPKVSSDTLIKAAGIQIIDDYENLAEKLLAYMEIARNYEGDKLFFLVNARSFIDDDMMKMFVEEVHRRRHLIFLLDHGEAEILPHENRVVIDANFCEF